MGEELLYKIALTLVPGVGDVLIRNLIKYCGSPMQIFKEKKHSLLKIPGVGNKIVNTLHGSIELKRAEREIVFIERNHIKPFFFTDQDYPEKLNYCIDSPAMLYFKGNVDLNKTKIIGIVGTRQPTEYGKLVTSHLINDLNGKDVVVVSGLAYGIDILAHTLCLENNISTVGVLAHGLDRIYPGNHSQVAKKMEKNGGLLSDFLSGTNPDRENFPKRNRVVAGLCDALVVVESDLGGGSMITAEIAHSYNRDVLAFPGKSNDEKSRGCNLLIKRNKAAMIESAEDLFYHMNWEQAKVTTVKKKQLTMPFGLTDEENTIYSYISEKAKVHFDELSMYLAMPASKLSDLLFNLEIQDFIRVLPGKTYSIN